MTRQAQHRATTPSHPVVIERREVAAGEALDTLVALREWLSADQVFVLESLSGPEADRRNSMVGVTGLLEVQVYRGEVSLVGLETLIPVVTRAFLDAGLVRSHEQRMTLVDDAALWELPRVLDDLFTVQGGDEHFGFGVLVFYGYDAVRYIERLPRTIGDRVDPEPDAVFSLVQALVSIDLRTGGAQAAVATSGLWPPLAVEQLCDVVACAKRTPSDVDSTVAVVQPRSVVDDITEAEYLGRVEVALEHIRLGDIYQVQLGHELTVQTEAEDVTVYRRLRWRNPSPYMSLIPIVGRTVIGASPELFLRLEDGRATMRPIAGTRRRSGQPARDAVIVEELRADPKEQAEHIMLVDLCRNDLGRIATAMSVDVTEMMVIEAYSHMFHIVSNVEATLVPGRDIYDVIRASFPAGTMTGAPKVRAMEIIESLESSRRGYYAGSFGFVDFGGWSILGLAIRMAVHSGDSFRMRASAGVVYDSDPRAEWAETLTKLGATYWAVTGKELT